MKLELHAVQDLSRELLDLFRVLGVFRVLRIIRISLHSPLVRQLRQIVGFELDTIYFVVATQLPYFLFTFLRRQLVLPVLIAGELIVELLLSKLLPPLLLGAE